MTFVMYLLMFMLVLGLIAVASNPSPSFGALGLVLVAGAGCGVILGHGGPFLSLVLFLIYLGGMLVVFAYSAALAAEPYPESWGNRSVLFYMITYSIAVVLAFGVFLGEWHGFSGLSPDEFAEVSVFRGDMMGAALLFSSGGGMLVVTACVLLLALMVVLDLASGLCRVALRAI